ncbi:hypothetical protein [Streptomyces sp. NPDC047043]|uniref:hypothetical protein n=1 Tax=Streptomyces sp. NPDC047043 TaxID=3154497 RepID=UPI0033DF51F0
MMNTGAALEVRGEKIYFPEPLTQATVIRRPNRFTQAVEAGGVDPLGNRPAAWIGINRTAANRYGDASGSAIPLRDAADMACSWVGHRAPRRCR